MYDKFGQPLVAADINETCYTKANFTDCPPGLVDGQGTVFTLIYGAGWRRQVFYTAHSVQGLRPSSYERMSASDPVAYGDWYPVPTAADLAGKVDAIGVYYQGDAADGVPDTSTDSALIVGLGQSKNAELWGALGHSYWAFIWQQFFASRSVTTLRTQLAVGSNGHMASRTYDNAAQAWTPWVGQATATKPQEHDLPLAAGITAVVRCKYRRNQEHEATTNLRCSFTAGLVGGQSLATLPPGYRPADIVTATCNIVLTNGSAVTGQIDIRPDGDIAVYPNASVSGSGSVIMSPVSFVAV